jgi:hypothetical protein
MMESVNNLTNEISLLQQVRTIVSSFGNALRTPKIQIHGFHLVFHHFCGLNHDRRVIAAKLGHKWLILRMTPEVSLFVALLLHHQPRMQHRRVAQLCAISAV